MATNALAQDATVVDLWEAYQFNGSLGFTRHLVLRLNDDRTFERFDEFVGPDEI